MAQGKITSTDIARMLGVAQSTVSRAFNPNASISDAKRQMILEGARRLGYTPNAMARGLVSKRSGLIAIVADNEANPVYDEIIRKLCSAIQRKGGQAVICLAEANQMEDAINKSIEYQVDGMVVATSHISNELLAKCRTYGIQLTLINQYINDVEASSFCTDNYLAGKEIAEYLLSKGYEKTAYLSGDPGSLVNEMRWEGFRDHLREKGATPPLYIPGTFTFNSGSENAEQLKPHTEIQAVFCANDIIAIGLLEKLKRLKEYRDLAVIGVDDITMSAWPSFELTSYRQPFKQLINAAIDELLMRIETKQPADKAYHHFAGELVIRSTA